MLDEDFAALGRCLKNFNFYCLERCFLGILMHWDVFLGDFAALGGA